MQIQHRAAEAATNGCKESVAACREIAHYPAMEKGDLTIKCATEGDVPRLLTLYEHLVPEDTRPDDASAIEAFAQFHKYPGSAIFLGELSGVLVVSCALVIVPNLTRRTRPYGLIENVVTHRDHRQRGYGRQVLDAATNAAWAFDCYKVMLLTGSKDKGTLNFYARAGFEQSKTGFEKRRIPARSER